MRYDQDATDGGDSVAKYEVAWEYADQSLSAEHAVTHVVQKVSTRAYEAPIGGSFTLAYGGFKGRYTQRVCPDCAFGAKGASSITTSVDLRYAVPRGDFVEVGGVGGGQAE